MFEGISVGGVFLNRRFRFLVAASSADGSGDDAAGGHGATAGGASGGVLSSFRRFADGRPDVPEEHNLVGSAGHDLAAAQRRVLQRRPQLRHFKVIRQPLEVGDAGFVTLLDGGDGRVAD